MGSVTPVVIGGEGYARVEVNWSDFPHTRKCWIERQVAGVSTRLRDGDAVPMSNGRAVAFDHEAPLDVPIRYASSIALNVNGDFADGVAEWLDTTNSGTIGTVTWSRDYYVPGVAHGSLKLTPTGVLTVQAASEMVPITAGTSYTFSGRLMVPRAWNGGIGLQVRFFNASNVLVSTIGVPGVVSPPAGEWTTFGPYNTGAAPATTTQAKLYAVMTGTPPIDLPLYAAEMYLTTAASSVVAAADVVIPSDGGGWWLDPLHPATKVRLRTDLSLGGCVPATGWAAYLGVAQRVSPADNGANEVHDSPYPASAWGVRKAPRSEIRVGVGTEVDRSQVRALHATGAPLWLVLPASYGEGNGAYHLYGDLTEQRIFEDQRRDARVIGAPFVEQEAPVGPSEGTWGARYDDYDLYATYADASAAGKTWLDGLQGKMAA